MDMIDGATVALSQLQASQDRAEREYETFGARVVEDLISDLMEGRAVTKVGGLKVDLAFLLDGEGFITDYEAALLVTGFREERMDLLTTIEARAKELVTQWVNESDIAAAVIAERVKERVLERDE